MAGVLNFQWHIVILSFLHTLFMAVRDKRTRDGLSCVITCAYMLSFLSSVQFHPEHTSGPQDLECLFDVFLDVVENCKAGRDISVQQLLTEQLVYRPMYPTIPAQRLHPR
jgi:hypothetical protein